MALETVTINGEQFRVHQYEPEYGMDAIGNPYWLGDDYLASDLTVLTPRARPDGKIYYEDRDIDCDEDMFVAFCTVPIIDGSIPVGVRHINGDKFDNTPENLTWIYDSVV